MPNRVTHCCPPAYDIMTATTNKETTTMTTNTTNWADLLVTDSDGEQWGTLGHIVESAPANLDNAEIEDGRIASWGGFLLSAKGEEPDWDTPRTTVNWDGFEQTRREAGGSDTVAQKED